MIRDKILEGLPLEDIFVFDCHTHLQPPATFYTADCNGAGMVKTMDRLGVNGIGLTSVFAFDSDVNFGNVHFHRLRYSELDLDQPFLNQFTRNQEKLLAILSRMADETK